MKLASLAFLLVLTPSLSAQSSLRGIVTSADSMPLRAVHVVLIDSAASVRHEMLTDDSGLFEFRLGTDAPEGCRFPTSI